MSEDRIIILSIHSRPMPRLRDGKYRRLAMEQLERRWLLSAAAGATGWWPADSSESDSATTWAAPTPAIISANALPAAPVAAGAKTWPAATPSAAATAGPAAAPVAASATAWPVAAPAPSVAATVPAAASTADCSGQGGWTDVGGDTSDNSSVGANGQTNSASSAWSSSGADQLPAKKPGLLVLSPDEFRAKSAGEGGLADVTRMSIQPPMALLAAASQPGDAAENGEGDVAPRPLSGDSMSGINLDGLRGTSQAFDVAVSTAQFPAGGASLRDSAAELGLHPATVWPMPMLPHARPDAGDLPATSTSPGAAAPLPGDGKTTFVPLHLPAAARLGSPGPSAGDLRTGDAQSSSDIAATEDDAKNLHGKAHDRVLSHVADFVHDLSVAARLNDRRVDTAIVAIALAALPYRRFRKRHDATL